VCYTSHVDQLLTPCTDPWPPPGMLDSAAAGTVDALLCCKTAHDNIHRMFSEISRWGALQAHQVQHDLALLGNAAAPVTCTLKI
jgi:hypothetical protein